MAGTAELLPDIVLGQSACFPPAIEMFEVLPDESCLGFVAENQVGISHRPVLAEVTRLANLEVAAKLRRRVRPQGNGHHGIEEFFGLFMTIDSRQIDQSELGKLPKQRQVNFKMMDKFREAYLGSLQVGERHHRRGRRRATADKIGNLSTK